MAQSAESVFFGPLAQAVAPQRIGRSGRLSPEDRRRIFDPFVRLGSDEISGAGIGLFSCRRVAEAQGGSLWYEDRPNGATGSVFAFSVPLARGDDR